MFKLFDTNKAIIQSCLTLRLSRTAVREEHLQGTLTLKATMSKKILRAVYPKVYSRTMMNYNALAPRAGRNLLAVNKDPFHDIISTIRGIDHRFLPVMRPRSIARQLGLADPLTDFLDMFRDPWGVSAMNAEVDKLSPILSCDVLESKDAFTMHVDLPGVKKEDLNVDITDDAIHIKGERKAVHEENSELLMSVERHYGKVARTIPMPKGINSKDATASFDNGVLEIRLPKLETEKEEAPRKLEISSNASKANV